MVGVVNSELDEIKYLQVKVRDWFQTEEKTAQAKEKLFRFINHTLSEVLRRYTKADEIRQNFNDQKYQNQRKRSYKSPG